jgi:hypothetical protein
MEGAVWGAAGDAFHARGKQIENPPLWQDGGKKKCRKWFAESEEKR